MSFLTDQTQVSGVSLTDLIHVVVTGDTSQNPAGSSFKASIQQVADAIGSSSFSGGTVPFPTYFTNGLSANTFSASTVSISTPTSDNSNINVLVRESSTGLIKQRTIPTTNQYGLFAQTGSSTPITNTIVETSLINSGTGTLTVPANGFNVGDSFRVTMIGVISCNVSATLRVKVKTGSVILGDTGVIPLDAATNKVWRISVDFTIRAIGVATVASIVTGGFFSYVKNSGSNLEGFNFLTVNNTTFDTTVSNVLDITAQWGAASVADIIYTDIFVLNKTH